MSDQAVMNQRVRTSGASQAHETEPLLLRVIPDVTRMTGLGKSTIFEAIGRGELKATRFGRAVRVHRDDLNAWIQANRDSAA